MRDRLRSMRRGTAVGTVAFAALAALITLTASPAAAAAPGPSGRTEYLRATTWTPHKYAVMAVNDLGMHCYQRSYAGFMVLPPANFVRVQIFRHGGEGAALVSSGIKVTYRVLNNTYSAGKTDFWDYAQYYGFPGLKKNVGITGNRLTGRMKWSVAEKAWIADAIPITPYTDSLVFQPLQYGSITVRSLKTGRVIARQPKFVIPVSDEMRCDYCHGPVDTAQNILQAHDTNEGTHLLTDLTVGGTPHACSECHADNAIGAPGNGALPLSQAMHGWHADKMTMTTVTPDCYACHPGAQTKCLRGRMASAGFTCIDAGCHGDMAKVADSQGAPTNRQAWLQEPTCKGCHGATYAENASTLYRKSFLMNGPEGMNGRIRCESCHGSPHAEWPSSSARDNQEPLYLQGKATFIKRCDTCHGGESGGIHGNTGG
jgi:hypothetical protein